MEAVNGKNFIHQIIAGLSKKAGFCVVLNYITTPSTKSSYYRGGQK